ncbi:MAG: sugar ABC transporter permease [Candidatus Methanomethylicaceae archaeon]
MKEQYKFLAPSLIVLILITIFPTIYLFYISFQKFSLRYIKDISFIGLGNYLSIISLPEFSNSVAVSIIYTFLSTILSFLIGLGLALLLNEEFKGRNLIRTLIVIPLAIPAVVAGFSWKFILSSEVGIIGNYLLRYILNLNVAPLAHPTLALGCVILADIWAKTPLMFLILLAGLQAIPKDFYDAAKVDGGTSWKIFRYITLPLLRPLAIIALIIRTIDAFNSFDVIFCMTKGGPGTSTQTLPLLGWKIGFLYYNIGEAAALAVLMIFMIIILSNILIRYAIR